MCLFECCFGAVWDGVRDGPVGPAVVFELFVGTVADGDDEVVGVKSVLEQLRCDVGLCLQRPRMTSSSHGDTPPLVPM